MSGGAFDYQQYRIEDIARAIEHEIENNEVVNEFGESNHFSPETLERFKEAVKLLHVAGIYVNRIDYLLSGDDGEKSFHLRLKEEMEEIDDE